MSRQAIGYLFVNQEIEKEKRKVYIYTNGTEYMQI